MLETASPAYDGSREAPAPAGLATRVADCRTGINPLTWLATDFLNQYNEIAMMLENIDAWPEGLLDLMEWQPLDYERHFAKSGLSDAELVITAFHHAPNVPRKRFELLVTETNAMLQKSLAILLQDYTGDQWEQLVIPGSVLAAQVRVEVAKLRRLINVENTNIEQDSIDALFQAERKAS
jgi:hypothetical protein